MKRSLSIVVTAALACSAFATLAAVAVAHTARYDSTVTISFHRGHRSESDTFSGKVISVKDRCEKHRKVVVRRRLDGPDALVGTALTDTAGDWNVQVASTPAGTYYARAKRKVLRRNSSHLHVCRSALSHDLEVHGKP
jgi:hypothetical protein